MFAGITICFNQILRKCIIRLAAQSNNTLAKNEKNISPRDRKFT